MSHGNENYSDLRIGNQPIEVKTGFSKFALYPQEFESFLQRYSSGTWKTGEALENCVLIFHRRDGPSVEQMRRMEEKGMHFAGYHEFHGWLERLVGKMKLPYMKIIKDAVPRIHSLDYIISLHQEISLRPFMLTRAGLQDRLEWSRKTIRSLSQKAEEARHAY